MHSHFHIINATQIDNNNINMILFFYCRKKAELNMEGQFLIRQIYDDEITYNLIGAAVEILSKLF